MAPDRRPEGPSNQHRTWESPESMLGVEEARERVLAGVRALEARAVPILDALGLVVAEPIVSEVDIPPFRNSAMDGYAVRSHDVAGSSGDHPVHLRVIDELAAGTAAVSAVGPGQAIRIMTGAVMPEGADAVVRFEETDEYDGGPRRGEVEIRRASRPWDNVRHPGEDIARGQVALEAGTVLRPAQIGILASLNRSEVLVHRRPRVGILSTGDEVVDLGRPLAPGQIRNSNSYTLAALIREAGGEPLILGIAADRVEEIRAKLHSGSGTDLLITSGGVSQGDFDMVKDVLLTEGEISLWQVRMKPGKPVAFGDVGSTPLLGLPGNPVAAFVTFLQFARPAIRKMLGRQDLCLPTVRARLLTGQENAGRRRHFVRGRVERGADGYVARPCGSQGAGVLSSAAAANCLIVVPEDQTRVEAGDWVEVELLPSDWSH